MGSEMCIRDRWGQGSARSCTSLSQSRQARTHKTMFAFSSSTGSNCKYNNSYSLDIHTRLPRCLRISSSGRTSSSPRESEKRGLWCTFPHVQQSRHNEFRARQRDESIRDYSQRHRQQCCACTCTTAKFCCPTDCTTGLLLPVLRRPQGANSGTVCCSWQSIR